MLGYVLAHCNGPKPLFLSQQCRLVISLFSLYRLWSVPPSYQSKPFFNLGNQANQINVTIGGNPLKFQGRLTLIIININISGEYISY